MSTAARPCWRQSDIVVLGPAPRNAPWPVARHASLDTTVAAICSRRSPRQYYARHSPPVARPLRQGSPISVGELLGQGDGRRRVAAVRADIGTPFAFGGGQVAPVTSHGGPPGANRSVTRYIATGSFTV